MTRTPTPSGRVTTPRPSSAAARSSLRRPAASHQKLAWLDGTPRPRRRNCLGDACPLGRDDRASASHLAAVLEGDERGRLGRGVDAEREGTGVDRVDDGRVTDEEADTQSGEAVGLRQRAQHGDVGTISKELDGVGDVGVRHELPVGLVDDDEAVGRHGVDDALQFGAAQHRRRRVVRVGEEDELRALAQRRDDRVGIERLAAQGHGRLDAAGETGELRVGDEARPRIQDLVAGIDVGQGELFQQADGAVAHGDTLAPDTDVFGEALHEGRRCVVGIAVDLAHRRGDGFGHAGQGAERRLVGSQGDGGREAVLGDRRSLGAARPVARHGGDAVARRGRLHRLPRAA